MEEENWTSSSITRRDGEVFDENTCTRFLAYIMLAINWETYTEFGQRERDSRDNPDFHLIQFEQNQIETDSSFL